MKEAPTITIEDHVLRIPVEHPYFNADEEGFVYKFDLDPLNGHEALRRQCEAAFMHWMLKAFEKADRAYGLCSGMMTIPFEAQKLRNESNELQQWAKDWAKTWERQEAKGLDNGF